MDCYEIPIGIDKTELKTESTGSQRLRNRYSLFNEFAVEPLCIVDRKPERNSPT